MSNDQNLTPYPLTMQLPSDFLPQHVLMIAINQAGYVRFDGEQNPFAYPALVALMASKLLDALAYSLTLGPTVPMPPPVVPTSHPGSA